MSPGLISRAFNSAARPAPTFPWIRYTVDARSWPVGLLGSLLIICSATASALSYSFVCMKATNSGICGPAGAGVSLDGLLEIVDGGFGITGGDVREPELGRAAPNHPAAD